MVGICANGQFLLILLNISCLKSHFNIICVISLQFLQGHTKYVSLQGVTLATLNIRVADGIWQQV